MCCLFQINTYEANVKEYSQGVFVVMVINSINKYTIKHAKRRHPLNETVFEASVLCLFIVSFKRCYNEYLLRFSSLFVEL